MPEFDDVLFDQLMSTNVKALVLQKLTKTWALVIKSSHYFIKIENLNRRVTLSDLQRNRGQTVVGKCLSSRAH